MVPLLGGPRYDGGVRSTTTGEDEDEAGPSSSIGEVLGEVLALLVRPSAVWDRGGETYVWVDVPFRVSRALAPMVGETARRSSSVKRRRRLFFGGELVVASSLSQGMVHVRDARKLARWFVSSTQQQVRAGSQQYQRNSLVPQKNVIREARFGWRARAFICCEHG